MCHTLCLCLDKMRIMEPLDQIMNMENIIWGSTMLHIMIIWFLMTRIRMLPLICFLYFHWFSCQAHREEKWNLPSWKDPAEGNGEANVLWRFKIPPLGIPGADCDVLEDIQEADDANGNTPAYSQNTWNKLHSIAFWKCFFPNLSFSWGTPLERMTRDLAILRFLRIKSGDFNRNSFQERTR